MQIPLSTFFESPEKWEGQEIAMRGFLYQKEGKTLLALEPNIPSCCLGKENKPFLVLHGEFIAIPSKATLVEGRIIKEPPLWIMTSTRFVNETSFFYESLAFILVVITLIIFSKSSLLDK